MKNSNRMMMKSALTVYLVSTHYPNGFVFSETEWDLALKNVFDSDVTAEDVLQVAKKNRTNDDLDCMIFGLD